LSRFGEAAANTGTLVLFAKHPATAELGIGTKTTIAMIVASLWRVVIMPVDTFKTTAQVTGSINPVFTKIRNDGVTVLYHGSVATLSAAFLGQFPWFFTYNYLSERIPPQPDSRLREFGRRGFIGFCASVVSDVFSNSMRVAKVYKQTSPESISYPVVIRRIVEESGLSSLFFRGLETRIFTNGLQGITFSVLWKYFEEILYNKR